MGSHAAPEPVTERIDYPPHMFGQPSGTGWEPDPGPPPPPAPSRLSQITWPMVGMAWVAGVMFVAMVLALVGDTRRASSTITMTALIGLIVWIVESRRQNRRNRE